MQESAPRFRSVLDQFMAYRPGRAVQGPDGRSFKLSSNESPHDPLPSVVAAITEAGRHVNRYPDNASVALTGAIGHRLAVPPEDIAVGCGSVGVTQQLLEAIGEPGAQVMYAWRSFEAYPGLVQLAAAQEVRVPLREHTHDLAAMAAAVTERTRLVFVCNPNNPTGTVVHRADIEAFLDRVPPTCLVVLDEAYREYVRDADVPTGIDLYRDRDNLAVLRTFSKAYGLAGLRVGYLVAREPVAAAIRKTMLPFTVNAVAHAAAIASLAAEAELLQRVEHVVKERTRVREELLGQGWEVPPSEGNFVWLALGEATMDFAAACERAGVSIRPFGGDGVRVTVGDREANDVFLAVAAGFPARTSGAGTSGAGTSGAGSGGAR
jgi:histidinol-phosphate aminotransferase